MEEKGLRVEDVRDRTLWRRKILSANPQRDKVREEDKEDKQHGTLYLYKRKFRETRRPVT